MMLLARRVPLESRRFIRAGAGRGSTCVGSYHSELFAFYMQPTFSSLGNTRREHSQSARADALMSLQRRISERLRQCSSRDD